MRNRHFHNIPLLALATAVLTVLALSLSPPTFATQGGTEGRTFLDNEFSDPKGLEDTTVDNYNVRLLLDNVSWTQTTDDNFEAGENLENVEVKGTGTDASVRIYRIGDSWTSMADTPSAVEAGGSLVWTGGDNIYALRGNDTEDFWRYSISDNSWTSLADFPYSIEWGSSLAWDNDDSIYALLEGGAGILSDNNFWRYSISDNSWTMMPDTPVAGGTGGLSAVWTSGDNIYALRGFYGGAQDDFWRFSIPDNSWTSRADTRKEVSWGGDLAWTGEDNIYALRGDDENDFWLYSISDNSWTSMADTPGTVNEGGQLVWAGGDNIYALRGSKYPNFTKDFWWYSILKNRWIRMTPTPNTVARGGSLVWMGGDNIYALRGNNDNVFWRYTLPEFLYDSGTFTSMVHDTGGMVSWGTISWDAYTPENITSLEIWTRTSSDNSSWSDWENCVNDNQVPSPENRYIQYRAIFSTSDIEIAPVLDEIRIKYEKYRSRGTFTSQAWDSGRFISSWGKLIWGATVPANSSITWRTQTSPNNVSWSSWENLGDDNSIQSPGNRYLRVEATLAGDNTVTPLLHEYTVYYTVWTLRVSVSILPGDNSALPGENVSFIVTVMNIGKNDDNYGLTADDNAGWSLYIENEVLEVPTGESRTTTLTVTILENALAYSEDNILVTATSQTDDTVSDNASCIARAGVVRGVEVSISPPKNEGVPGVELKYTVTIKNTGNAGDNFTLGKTQTKNWGLGLPTLIGPLGPGENGNVALKVLIPFDAENGTEDKITVTATSRANPSVSDNDSCIARAIVRGVSVLISPQEDNAAPDENVTFTVTVKNTGEVADDYELTVTDNAGWGAWLDDSFLEDVSPDESRQTTVRVTVPSDAIEGELTVIAVTATSQADPNVENSAECTAKAKAEERPSGFPWLPVAAVVIIGAIIVVILVVRPFFSKPTPARFW